MMKPLIKEEIIRINQHLAFPLEGREALDKVLLRENALDYLIEVVDSDMMEKPLYPEVYQKAGVYLFNIICDFVFTERNLPTAFAATLFFLKQNGHGFKSSLKQDEIAAFIQQIAEGNLSLKEVQLWLKQSITLSQSTLEANQE